MVIKFLHYIWLSLVLIIYCRNSLKGQPFQFEKIAFQSLTINNGLSQGMVNQILQDKYGYMWFATKDGLNKYDGFNFEIFRHDADDTSSLSDGYIQSIFEDSQGKIWIGTLSGGLDLFDHTIARFYHILQKNHPGASSMEGPILQTLEDNQRNIWVLYRNKIIILKNAASNNTYTQMYKAEDQAIPHLINPILFKARSGAIYLFNYFQPNFYLYSNQTNQWSLKTITTPDTITFKIPKEFKIYNIFQDMHSEFLYAFCNNGIVRFDSSFNFYLILNYPSNLESQFQSFIDRENQIWFRAHERLCVYNIYNNNLRFLSPSDESQKIKVGLIHSSFIDRSGLIWFGTKGYGLLTLNLRAQLFHHTENTSVYDIRETEGRILINSGDQQYKVLNKNIGIYTDTISTTDAKIYNESFNEFSIPTILDSQHRRWFANHLQLVYFNTRTKETKEYLLPENTLRDNQITITDIKVNKDKIWLSSSEGLYCFNLTNNKWQIFRNNPKDTKSLSFNSLLSLCLDPKQPEAYLWVGTNGGGLNRMEIATGECVRYTIKNGLPNDVIYSILNDDKEQLWMSTNKGLSCFNLLNNTFKNFEENDGLQSNEFNQHASLRSSDGILFFGGVNGYNYFKPDDIKSNPISPQIVINNILIKNKLIQFTPHRIQVHRSVYLTHTLTLPYEDNVISFEFAALDFLAPEKNQYKYILEGFDENWVHSANTHIATYTNLNPGKYTLKVKGSNADGDWNEEAATMKLIIIPPWYMTWWFRLLVLSSLSTLAYSFYNYRLNQTLKLMAIRNRIATDLHDEIGSNLSNIAIFSEVAQQRHDDKNVLLKKISSYTQTSMEAMNDIVWMVNTRNDRFENIINRMRQNAAETLEVKGYNVHLYIDERINALSMNMEERKHFYLIYKESINNIAKYAQGKNAWITLSIENQIFTLIVKDDGIGFDSNAPSSGNGLINLNHRAAALHGHIQINSIPQQGSEIKLEFKL